VKKDITLKMLDELNNERLASYHCHERSGAGCGTNVEEKIRDLEHLLGEIETSWKEGLSLCNDILAVDETHQGALRMRHQLTMTFFPEWHIPMMQDEVRNIAFRRALERINWKEKTVLEIGTGAGLLAMLIAKSGAEHVFTCESNTVLADAAVGIIKDNNLEEKITVIPKKSSEIVVGRDLPHFADVLVTETLGSDFLNESILSILDDARDRLLSPGALVLPGRVRLYGCLISSPQLRKNKTVEGFGGIDLTGFNHFAQYRNFQLFDASNTCYNTVSSSELLLEADLTNGQVETNSTVNFKVNESGYCDGIMYWMSVDVDDRNAFSNSPFGDPESRTHWRQCAFLFVNKVKLESGKNCSVDVLSGKEFLRFVDFTARANSRPDNRLVVST